MRNALEGIKVIDAAQVIAAPLASRHLADMGADVIHVENAKSGDLWHGYLKDVAGTTAVPAKLDYNWEIFNRNKRDIALDLSQKDGQQILYKMVESADIFVTNFRIYEREKFACNYRHLKEINPKIIYASITGVGKEGPERDNPAFDQTVYWFRAGANRVLLPPGICNIGYRAGFGDTIAAMALYGAIMTAMFHRERTGEGQEVEVSLLGAGLYQLSFDVSGALLTGKDFKDMNEENRDLGNPDVVETERLTKNVKEAFDKLDDNIKANTLNPLAVGYFTKDNRWVHLNILQPDLYWVKICNALGIEDIIQDPRFINHEIRIKNHKALYHIVKDAIGKMLLEDVYKKLVEWRIPFAVQQKVSEVIHDPQARANNYFVKFEHPVHGPIEILASPMNMSETPASYRLPAPEFSQHTEEVLLEHGYSWEDIAKFKENRIIP